MKKSNEADEDEAFFQWVWENKAKCIVYVAEEFCEKRNGGFVFMLLYMLCVNFISKGYLLRSRASTAAINAPHVYFHFAVTLFAAGPLDNRSN